MLKAVIFDFDGVICDSEPLHFQAFNDALEKDGVEIPISKYYRDYLGYTDYECIEAVNKDYSMGLDEKGLEDLARRKCEFFEELVKQKNSIIQGVPELLKLLKADSVRMAICSGAIAYDVQIMLEGSDLADFFEFIVSADDVKKGKPDAEGYLLSLEKLNDTCDEKIEASDCIVIEDSHWGIKAAQKAGMPTVAVTNTYAADEFKTADLVVERLDELTIKQLRNLCD